MTRLPIPSSDSGQWGDILNDYLLAAHAENGSHRDILSVREYGAVGDGVTDDTAAIQAAIAAATTRGSCILFFPAAAYRLSGTLTLDTARNIRLVGQGTLLDFSQAPSTVTAIAWTGIGSGNPWYQTAGGMAVYAIDSSLSANSPAISNAIGGFEARYDSTTSQQVEVRVTSGTAPRLIRWAVLMTNDF